MASTGRPDREQFSSLLQSVSPPRPRSINFKSMEDNVPDLASSSASDMGHNTSLSSIHSRDSPILPSSSSSSINSPLISPNPKTPSNSTQSKDPRSNRSLSIDYGAPNDVTNQVIPSSGFLTRSASFGGNSQPNNIASRKQKRFHGVDEALSSQQATPFIDVSHYTPPPTPRTPHSSIRYSRREKAQQQRTSIDLGYSMMQASLRRLRRSPSLWTTGDRSLAIHDDRHVHNLRAEPQLSDQQKIVVLRRARKIVQVFGSEAPVDVVHGNGYIHRHSTHRRGSLSTIVSGDAHPSVGLRRRRSNSASSLLLEMSQSPSTSSDGPKTSSYVALDIEETSFFPSSSFSERRRRAAKLAHFFGVNCQDISQSIGKKFLPPTSQQTCFGTNGMNNSAAEVDVKVVGRRFWGMSDGETKTAHVADVIGKLRGLRAG